MSPYKRMLLKDLGLAGTLIVAGLVISGLSLVELRTRHPQVVAQATQPLQAAPHSESGKPAESKPGGTRPTTPAPEPAQPDPAAQKAGVKPALPPAPAEKIAPPIKDH